MTLRKQTMQRLPIRRLTLLPLQAQPQRRHRGRIQLPRRLQRLTPLSPQRTQRLHRLTLRRRLKNPTSN